MLLVSLVRLGSHDDLIRVQKHIELCISASDGNPMNCSYLVGLVPEDATTEAQQLVVED